MSTTRDERAQVTREIALEAARARFVVEHGEQTRCPNCSDPILNHPENNCVLAALIDCVRDRNVHDEHTCLNLHFNCNTDRLWDDYLGPLVDELERGGFNRG